MILYDHSVIYVINTDNSMILWYTFALKMDDLKYKL